MTDEEKTVEIPMSVTILADKMYFFLREKWATLDGFEDDALRGQKVQIDRVLNGAIYATFEDGTQILLEPKSIANVIIEAYKQHKGGLR